MTRFVAVLLTGLSLISASAYAQEGAPGPGTVEVTVIPGGGTFYTSSDQRGPSFGNYNLVVFFVLVVATAVAAGVPIAFAFGVATLAYLALMTRVPLTVVIGRMDEGMSHLILLAVPLWGVIGLLAWFFLRL